MTDQSGAAHSLGMDHSEAESHGEPFTPFYSGREVARALGITEELTGDEYVALRESYNSGRADYW